MPALSLQEKTKCRKRIASRKNVCYTDELTGETTDAALYESFSCPTESGKARFEVSGLPDGNHRRN